MFGRKSKIKETWEDFEENYTAAEAATLNWNPLTPSQKWVLTSFLMTGYTHIVFDSAADTVSFRNYRFYYIVANMHLAYLWSIGLISSLPTTKTVYTKA